VRDQRERLLDILEAIERTEKYAERTEIRQVESLLVFVFLNVLIRGRIITEDLLPG
jgi:hypothetical protein